MEEASTEVPVREIPREERVLTYEGLMERLRYTLEETLVQEATVGYGRAELLTSNLPRHVQQRSSCISSVIASFSKIECHTRGIQRAIELTLQGKPVSLIQHTEKNWVLDLDTMGREYKLAAQADQPDAKSHQTEPNSK